MLANEPRAVIVNEETARLLADGIAKLGLSNLPWSKSQIQLRGRVGFLRAAEEGEWPDLTDAALAKTVAEWLAPFLAGKTKVSEIGADDLGAALDALLPWNLKRRLDEEAPTHFEAPTGNRHAIAVRDGGRPCPAHPRAGVVRADAPSFDRPWKAAAHFAFALAGAAPCSNCARPSGLLERIVVGG